MEIKVSDLVLKVREQLEQVEKDLQESKRDNLFELQSLDLELHFSICESDTTKGGFDIKVLSLGSDAAYASEQVQKVILRYQIAKDAAEKKIAGYRASFDVDDIKPIDND